jgi:hypothetical protein
MDLEITTDPARIDAVAAHAFLRAPLGFRPLAAPEGYLEIARPGLYLAARPRG